MSPEKELANLIANRLLNVAPDSQDLQLEDSDYVPNNMFSQAKAFITTLGGEKE